ncbi:MAG: flagellar hook-associated protein 3 [Rickettsiales bacterium]|nr:flagellar hook-associated protein 3 [Rickettsiales bacterium]|tara:strand:- start:6291 stop:7580 length:1290 start_codon:yes stop_codon:yes gene_type:complete
MKISNKLFNTQQVNQFSKQMENIQKIQSQISSGKNIIFASDDPVGAVQLSGLKDVKSKIDQYIDNTELARERLALMDSTLEASKNIFIRCNELSIQAANDILSISDREAIALEFDELKKELLSLANTKDARGSSIYAGFKTKTVPFELDSAGAVTYKGDRGTVSVAVSESRMLETTIDGGSVFQDIVTSEGVSTDLFAAVDNISRSIRTANSHVEAAKAPGIAKLQLTNENPGTYSFTVTSGDKTADINVALTGSDLSDLRTAINAADLDITATISTTSTSNDTLTLTNTYSKDITISNVGIPEITAAQEETTSFFTFQPIDAAGASLGNAQKLVDFDQTIASRLDELVAIQNHLSNQRAKVGSRLNSADRQRDVMDERKIQISKNVSDLEDADLSKLVTELQSKLVSQEASQKAFVRITQLNLFDYIS